MFFTITSIQNVIVDAGSFHDDPALFEEVLDLLQSQDLQIALVRSTPMSQLNTRGLEVFSAASWVEAIMFQNTMRRAITSLGGKTTKTVFLTVGDSHLEKANSLLIGTIAFEKSDISEQQKIDIRKNFPDFCVSSIKDLKQVLTGEFIGYGGEYFAAPAPRIFQSPAKPSVEYQTVPNEEHADCPVHVCGRYFGKEDARHKLHPLSVRIVGSKGNPERQAIFFSNLYAHAVQYVTRGKFDYITCIPPRPDEENRMEHFMKPMPQSKFFAQSTGVANKIRAELLKCTKNYPKAKNLGFADRKKALEGAFTATEDLTNKTIVLIDDVRSTGSTMNEAIRALKAAGAMHIKPLVLGYHPLKLTLALDETEDLHCERSSCKKILIPRTRTRDGNPFYGCSGYSPQDAVGHTNKDFNPAVLKKLTNFESKALQPDPELESLDIDF